MIEFGNYPRVSKVKAVFSEKFPYFSSVLDRLYDEFGIEWLERFETELATFFINDFEGLAVAVEGYGRFALDGMRLQKKFDKTRQYDFKTYAEAASSVYQNRDYMFSLYLPGILLSHYLWRHHYRQHIFFKEKYLPLMRARGGESFADIGVGTGFYSKEMLVNNPGIVGRGYDLSPFSLEHTNLMLNRWGVADRYVGNLQDVVENTPHQEVPFLVNVEVLEHLEQPLEFLKSLNKMLSVGGYGFISAAITAPNADHIYLYSHPDEVIEQLTAAGFSLVDYVEDWAYTPRQANSTAPRNGAFIVTKS